MKKTNGITLIALVITIIILLILASITISLTLGKNGLLNRADEASVIHENADVYEQLGLKITDYELSKKMDGIELEYLNKLKADNFVKDDNSLNANTVAGKNLKTGKGTVGIGDVYVIEQLDIVNMPNDYFLVYYNKDNEPKNLGKVFIENLEYTSEDYFDFYPETGSLTIKNILSYYSGLSYTFRDLNLGLKTLIIPASYNGQTVTNLGNTLHYGTYRHEVDMGFNITDVEKIIIPNTVTKINSTAFAKSTNLKEVVIPNSVISIDVLAFADCTSLQEFHIPSSVTSIGGSVFADCTSLQKIHISSSVTSIGGYAFSNCTSLQEIHIPSSVTSIGKSAFSNWNSTQKIYVPFKEGETPEGWNVDWNKDCNAQIIYQD